jgi:hypothetical protein
MALIAGAQALALSAEQHGHLRAEAEAQAEVQGIGSLTLKLAVELDFKLEILQNFLEGACDVTRENDHDLLHLSNKMTAPCYYKFTSSSDSSKWCNGSVEITGGLFSKYKVKHSDGCIRIAGVFDEDGWGSSDKLPDGVWPCQLDGCDGMHNFKGLAFFQPRN